MAVSVGHGQHLSLGAVLEESLSVWLLLIGGMGRVSIAFGPAGVSGQVIRSPSQLGQALGLRVKG